MKYFDNNAMRTIRSLSPDVATENSGYKNYPLTAKSEEGFLSWEIKKGKIYIKYTYQTVEQGGSVSIQYRKETSSTNSLIKVLRNPIKEFVA